MAKNIKKKLIIDADPLLFQVCEGKFTKGTFFSSEKGNVEKGSYKEPLKQYKKRFKLLIQDIENEIAVEILGKYKLKGKTKISLSDPDGNFRYDIYPQYKANRDSDSRGELFYRLRKWALKEYGYIKGIESDDNLAHHVRKGWIAASNDKDIYKGVAGTHFDFYHSRRHIIETSFVEARNFNFIQTLMGDPTDNIPALPKKKGDPMIPADIPKGQRQPFKVTEKIACEILDEFGWTWDGVVKGFESRGFSEKDAELNRRLICLNQWTPKKGIKLFKSKLT